MMQLPAYPLQRSWLCCLDTVSRNYFASLASVLFATFLLVNAAFAAPFSCSGQVYQVQSGQLRIFDTMTSTYVDVGTPQTMYNGAGYNILDNYVYGIQTTNTLVRVESDGTTTTLFGIGSIGNTPAAGDMDNANNLFINSTSTSFKRINVTTGVVTSVSFTGPGVGTSDWVWAQSAGVPYLIGFESNGRISRINLSANTSANVIVSGLPTGSSYGATWKDSANRVFTFNNQTGAIYEVFNFFTATPTATLVATGTPSILNDGFSCTSAPFPNLPPLAFNDALATLMNTPVSGDVLINNGSGVDRDPESTALTVTTTPVSGPSNGSVSLSSTGAFTYTPNTNYFGTDTFVYRITDASGLTDTATVTITIAAPTANLVTVKTLSSATATPSVGDTVQFQIAVTNNGPDLVPNPTLTDMLPAGLTYITSTPSQGSYVSGTGLWTLGSLANGATATLTISATVNSGQQGATITNTTTAASGGNIDGTSTGDDLTETVVVKNPAHTISKTQSSGPNPVTATGQTIGFTITVANSGNQALTSVVVTDAFTLGGSPRSLTTGPTRTTGDSNANDILDLAETWTYQATYVTTQADLDGTGTYSNIASVTSAQTSATTSNTVATSVTRTANLAIDKTANTLGPVIVNDIITYNYTVTNIGNVTMTAITVADSHNGLGTLPVPSSETLLTDVAPTGDSTDTTSNNRLWSNLAPGDSVRFSASYTVTQNDIDQRQ